MSLEFRKKFFFILMFVSGLVFGYRLGILIQNNFNTDNAVYDYSVVTSFFLLTIGSFYEWITIRKLLESKI